MIDLARSRLCNETINIDIKSKPWHRDVEM